MGCHGNHAFSHSPNKFLKGGREPFSLFHYSELISLVCFSVTMHCRSLEASIFILSQQQNLGRRFGVSKMHLNPTPTPTASAAVRSKAVVLLLLIIV